MISTELLQKLITQPEGTKLEFKEEVNLEDKFAMADFLHHLLSLANSMGNTAYLIIGVEDETKRIVGLKENHTLSDEKIQQLVSRYCSPPISFSFSFASLDNKQVGIVEIPPSSLKPHSFSEEIAGRVTFPSGKEKQWRFPRNIVYIRRGPITEEAVIEEIELMKFEAIKNRERDPEGLAKKTISQSLAVPLAFSPVPVIRGFIGREDELRHIQNDFENSPIVILEGLAGIGKSTLAIKYIRENINDLKNAFWLECQDKTSLEDVLMAFSDYARRNADQKIAQAIDEQRPISDRIFNLTEALGDRRALICLDAFEHADGISMGIFLQKILQHPQNIKVLICTRERPKSFVGILSEIEEVHIKGLQIEDSIELLKAELAKKKFQEKLDVTFDEIAQKTEGHPFAIKLFVPLVYYYGVSARKLLNGSPEFGKTLEQNWLSEIFIRLSSEEREMLERFSIFTEPVKREGIQFVFPSSDWSSYLQMLQDKFLISFSQNLFSTHALIQEFCLKKLQIRDELRATAIRAADYYLHDQNIINYNKEQSQEQIDAKLRGHHYLFVAGEYFQAARIVKNIQSNLMKWSRYSQLSVLIDKTFETINEINLDDRQVREWKQMLPWLKYYKARLLFAHGKLEESLGIFQELIQENDNILVLESIQMIANIYLEMGLSDEVIKLYENHLDVFKHRDKKIQRMLEKIGMVYIQSGKLETAMALYQQILDWQQADNDSFGGAITLRQLAIIYLAKDDIVSALNFAKISRDLAKDSGDLSLIGAISKTLGDAYNKNGEVESATEEYENALKIFSEIENHFELQRTGESLVRLYEKTKNDERRNEVLEILGKHKISN